jgi:hypothetical protein
MERLALEAAAMIVGILLAFAIDFEGTHYFLRQMLFI